VTRHIAIASVALALGCTLLSGCGGSSSSKPSSTPTARSSPSTAPSRSVSPTQQAGDSAALAHASVTLPESWNINIYDADQIMFTDSKHCSTSGIGESGGWPANETATKKNIDRAAKQALDDDVEHWRRLPDLVVNGTRLYHLTRKADAGWNHDFGTMSHGYLITVDFEIDQHFCTRKWLEPQMDQVMSTFKLR